MAYKASLIDETESNQQLADALAQIQNIGEFGYDDSNGYLAQRDAALNSYLEMQNTGYLSQYTSNIDELFDKIMNYGDFSYDAEKDGLFQMYKQQYQREGQQAMKNQLGIATAQTGGYNSSYAQSSAQKAYQDSVKQLGEKSLELSANAFQQYQNEHDNLLERYNLLNEADKNAENSYYNQLSAKKNSIDVFDNLYGDDYSNQYNAWSDKANQAQSNYNNAVAQNNWIKEYNATETNNANTLNQNQSQFDAQQKETKRHNNQMEKIAKKAATGKTSKAKKK